MGITSQKLERRWRKGKGYAPGSFVRNAINKYGWENVEKEIIASHQTQDEAKNFERLLIEKLDLMNPEKGYNQTSGGEMVSGYFYSENVRKKMSEKKQGVFDGGKNPHAKAVVCIETGELFPTAREASRFLGLGKGAISIAIGRGQETCGGYHWRYATEDEVPKRNPKQKIHAYIAPANIRPVYCEELDRIFPSVLAASKELHCSQCAINYSAKGKVKNPRKYHWRYVDEMERNGIKGNDAAPES